MASFKRYDDGVVFIEPNYGRLRMESSLCGETSRLSVTCPLMPFARYVFMYMSCIFCNLKKTFCNIFVIF